MASNITNQASSEVWFVGEKPPQASKDECIICYEERPEGEKWGGHHYKVEGEHDLFEGTHICHFDCLKNWFLTQVRDQGEASCPLCRRVFDPRSHDNPELTAIVQQHVGLSSSPEDRLIDARNRMVQLTVGGEPELLAAFLRENAELVNELDVIVIQSTLRNILDEDHKKLFLETLADCQHLSENSRQYVNIELIITLRSGFNRKLNEWVGEGTREQLVELLEGYHQRVSQLTGVDLMSIVPTIIDEEQRKLFLETLLDCDHLSEDAYLEVNSELERLLRTMRFKLFEERMERLLIGGTSEELKEWLSEYSDIVPLLQCCGVRFICEYIKEIEHKKLWLENLAECPFLLEDVRRTVCEELSRVNSLSSASF